MTFPTSQRLYDAIEVTWPSLSQTTQYGWVIRNGAGAGKRVSAASLVGDALPDIAQAEQDMLALGQPKLFQVRDGEDALDAALDTRGYRMIDKSVLYACENAILLDQKPELAQSYAIWEPIQVMREIWNAGGINDARIGCMHRVQTAKTGIIARSGDSPVGTAFLAMDGDCAMIHAVEVLKNARRQGAARKIMRHAAHWAADHGAKYMTLVTTVENDASNTLYRNLGMTIVGQYHYRIKD